MSRTTPLYANWTAGELSQRLAGRSDIKNYYAGASELTNVLVWAHGGITKRPGTYYKSTAIDSTKAVRLVPFEYSTTQAYIIEFGDETARFYMDSGIIVTSGTTPYQIATPWPAEDLDSLRYVQSADIMYVVHPDYPPQKLTRTGHTAWTITEQDFLNGPFLEMNETAITITPSAITGSISLTASSAIFDADHVNSVWRIQGNLTKSASLTAINQFTSAIQVDAGESVIVQLNGTWVANVYLQRSLDEGATWLDYKLFTANTSLSYPESQDGVFYRMGINNSAPEYTSGTAEVSLIKMEEWGTVKITSFTGGTVVSGTVVRDLPSTDATTDWSEGQWSDLNGWPETAAFFEQRLLYGGNFNRPQTVWASKTDSYDDFNAGTGLDDDAYSFTMVSSDVNSIRWMVDADTLRIGTHGGEWRFGLRDSATTPTNVDVKRYSSAGSAALPAALIGSSVLFIQRGGVKLRAMTYDLSQEAYVTPEITIRAEHILKEAGGAIDMTYAAQPDPTIWMVTATGTLVGCTYDQTNGISAFHEHETDGYFESIASIPGTDRDEVWVVVRRTIDGTDVRYIEQFQTTEWLDQDDAIYLDSCLTYTGLGSTTTISGLEHLEGEEVYLITDGATHAPQTVASGVIELNWTADKVHIGLRYISDAVTMALTPETEGGTSMGKRKKGHKLIVGFYKTNYCKIGAYGYDLDIIPFRQSADLMDTRVPLYTETREAAFPHGFERDLRIHIRSDLPLPFSIVGLAPVMSTSPA